MISIEVCDILSCRESIVCINLIEDEFIDKIFANIIMKLSLAILDLISLNIRKNK
jgi:hypothetical protein